MEPAVDTASHVHSPKTQSNIVVSSNVTSDTSLRLSYLAPVELSDENFP